MNLFFLIVINALVYVESDLNYFKLLLLVFTSRLKTAWFVWLTEIFLVKLKLVSVIIIVREREKGFRYAQHFMNGFILVTFWDKFHSKSVSIFKKRITLATLLQNNVNWWLFKIFINAKILSLFLALRLCYINLFLTPISFQFKIKGETKIDLGYPHKYYSQWRLAHLQEQVQQCVFLSLLSRDY